MASSFPLLSSVQSIEFSKECDALLYSPMACPSCEHQVIITRQDGTQKIIDDVGNVRCGALAEALDSKIEQWAKDHFSQEGNPYFLMGLISHDCTTSEEFAEKLLAQWFS